MSRQNTEDVLYIYLLKKPNDIFDINLWMDYNKTLTFWMKKGTLMKYWLFRWGPAILIMGLIFLASSTSGSEIPDFGRIDFFTKKLGHLIGYALLGAALFHCVSGGGSINAPRALITMSLVFLYAVSDEWHQSFTPGRNPAFQDICIDTVGGFLGMAFLHQFRKRILHRNRKEFL